jgi:hypothetical protein
MDPRGGKPAEIELPAMDPRVGDGGPTSSASVAAARQANRVARAMAVAPGSPSSRQRLPLLRRPPSPGAPALADGPDEQGSKRAPRLHLGLHHDEIQQGLCPRVGRRSKGSSPAIVLPGGLLGATAAVAVRGGWECSVPRCMWRFCARTQRLLLLCRSPVRARERENQPPGCFPVAIQAPVQTVLWTLSTFLTVVIY